MSNSNIYIIPVSYRKIYEEHYGPIPKDTDGRTYEIHHADGDHNNNELSNLVLLSIQEHYDEHFSRGDWYACSMIATRMKKTPAELSYICSMLAKKQVADGTHPWQGSEKAREREIKKVKNGTHAWQKSNHQKELAIRRAAEGTLPGQIAAKNGTHNFTGGEIQRKSNQQRVANKSHHLLGSSNNKMRLSKGTHPSQIKASCVCCRNTYSIGNLSRHKCRPR